MKNDNYKDRLRQHKTPFNPQAWEQMEGMLDSLDRSPSKIKFVKWIPIILLIALGMYWVFASQNPDHSVDQFIELETKDGFENKDIVDSAKKLTTNTHNKVKAGDYAKDTKTTVESIAKDLKLSKNKKRSTSKKAKTSTKVSTSENHYNRPLKEQIITKDKSEVDHISNNISTETTRKIINDREIDFSFSQPKSSNKTEGKEVAYLPIGEEKKIQKVESLQGNKSLSTTRISVKELSPIPLSINLLEEKKEVSLLTTVTESSKIPFFLENQIGYSILNSRYKGILVGSGVTWEFDDLLHLSANAVYAYGKGISYQNEKGVESQLDFAIYLHLVFYDNQKHYFSLDPGIGYSFFNRNIENGDSRFDKSNQGQSYQLRLNYKYSLSHNTRIGLNVGASIFDDIMNYFTLKIAKRL